MGPRDGQSAYDFMMDMADRLAGPVQLTTDGLVVYVEGRHKTTRLTPAQAASLTDTWHDAEWIVGLVDAAAPKPAKPGPKGPRKPKG